MQHRDFGGVRAPYLGGHGDGLGLGVKVHGLKEKLSYLENCQEEEERRQRDEVRRREDEERNAKEAED